MVTMTIINVGGRPLALLRPVIKNDSMSSEAVNATSSVDGFARNLAALISGSSTASLPFHFIRHFGGLQKAPYENIGLDGDGESSLVK